MSTVIKAGEEPRVVRRLATVELADHLAEARALIENARSRAAGMIADAERRAAELTRDATAAGREAGYRAGYDAGCEEGRAGAFREAAERFEANQADAAAALKRAVDELAAQRRDLLIAAEQNVLHLAIMIAKKLTFAVGTLHREAVLENLRESLRMVGTKSNVLIRANPIDVQTLETFAADAARHVENSMMVRIVADESIAPGGCCVETERTAVDATLETQVNAIVALLTGSATNHA